MDNADATSIAATHLVLPGWWVRAYEAAAQAEAGASDDGAMELACAAGLAPALMPLELNALAMVLGNLQSQILAGRTTALTLSVDEHLKHAGTAARSRRFVFEKVVQLLTGLRLLRPGEGGALLSLAPFAGDRWIRQQREVSLVLTPGPLGAEVLLGLADAHVDLVRFARGEDEAATALGDLAPLALWRSVWLDLSGPEQLLFLRLERSMQWEFRWLQLEGIFGVPVAELFSGLRVPGGDGTDLVRRLKVLVRLGRKLAAHGFLAPSVADQYLAIDGDANAGLTLVWQAARERLASDVGAGFRTAAAGYMLRHRHPMILDDLARLCLPTGGDGVAAARELWETLGAVTEAPLHLPGFEGRPGQMVLPRTLFLEYQLRRQPGCRFPLPETLLAGPVGALTAPGTVGEVAGRFARFCQVLAEDGDFPRDLRQVPYATLASPATRSEREFAGFAATVLAPALSGTKGAAAVTSSKIPAASAGARAVAGDGPNASDGSGAGDGASRDQTVPRLVAAATDTGSPPSPPAGAPRRQAALSGALASRMLKIASDELAKMRASDPDHFQTLKRTYLESLDEAGRKLMLDVQRRIQPSMFEEQLRQRLVRYMVDNPGAWRSAETGKAGT